jgi:hypothetical protein
LPPKSPLGPAVYLLALALFITPLVDVVTITWPPQFGLAEWRYGFLGNSANYLLTPVLGLAVAGFGADFLNHRGMQRLVAVLCILMAIASLGGLGAFTLDVIEVRQAVVDEAMPTFSAGAMKAGFKLGLTGIVLLAMSISFWRASRVARAVELGTESVEWRPGSEKAAD